MRTHTTRHRRRRMAVIMLLVAITGCGSWLVYDSGVLYITSERVEFTSADGTPLVGDIVMPRAVDGPMPAVVIVHGSGMITRSALRGWARSAIDAGFIVLTYDKRGVGESGGTYTSIPVAQSAVVLRELAADATAAWDVLAARPDVDATRVGFMGGSQAGWIMPLAAQERGDAAFIVAVSGPAVTYGQEIEYSRLTGDDPGSFAPGELSESEIATRMAAFDGPHGYDPMPVLRSVSVPSLWLLGGGDPSVPTALSVANFNHLREDGQNNHCVIVYPRGDHNLGGVDYWQGITVWMRENAIIQAQHPRATEGD